MIGALIRMSVAHAECYSDFNCGYGNKCVKASGDINITGGCIRPSDQFGNPNPDYSAPQHVRGCSFDTNFGIGFTCLKRNSQIYGICVK